MDNNIVASRTKKPFPLSVINHDGNSSRIAKKLDNTISTRPMESLSTVPSASEYYTTRPKQGQDQSKENNVKFN